GAAQEQKVRSMGTRMGNLRKVRRETRDNHAQGGRCKRVCLHALSECAARRKLPADGSVNLVREKRGDSGDPRVRGLGNDQIVLLARSKEEVVRVIENNVNARITQDITIEASEIRRRAYHGGPELHASDSLACRSTADRRSL